MKSKDFIINDKNVEEYCEKITEWIKTKVDDANASGVVLGMSSGIDSSVVAALCKKAGIYAHLVLLPYGDNMKKSNNYEHAMELIKKFDFSYHIFDIKPAVDAIQIPNDSDILNGRNENAINLSRANIRPRIRMIYLYQYAQINNLLVIGTGNLSEATVGYFTKWGDGAHDINPIAKLTKKEVYIVAKYLGVPDCIINKKPSADLWEGQTDEDELGILYNQIDDYILKGTSGNEKIDRIIEDKYKKTEHKRNIIPYFND